MKYNVFKKIGKVVLTLSIIVATVFIVPVETKAAEMDGVREELTEGGLGENGSAKITNFSQDPDTQEISISINVTEEAGISEKSPISLSGYICTNEVDRPVYIENSLIGEPGQFNIKVSKNAFDMACDKDGQYEFKLIVSYPLPPHGYYKMDRYYKQISVTREQENKLDPPKNVRRNGKTIEWEAPSETFNGEYNVIFLINETQVEEKYVDANTLSYDLSEHFSDKHNYGSGVRRAAVRTFGYKELQDGRFIVQHSDFVFTDAYPVESTENDTGVEEQKEDSEEEPKAEAVEEKVIVATPETHYGVFQESVIKDIDLAIKAASKVNVNKTVNKGSAVVEPIKIDTWTWISFKKNVYQKMQESGLPVQITFRHKGIRYQVNIPANADLMSLVDKNGYCGFLNLMAHFGGTVIEK